MAINETLASMSQDDAIAYLRQLFAEGKLTPEEIAALGGIPYTQYVNEEGVAPNSVVQSRSVVWDNPYNKDRGYVAEFNPDGSLKQAGLQGATSWYGREGPLGIPVGAWLVAAAPFAGQAAYNAGLTGGSVGADIAAAEAASNYAVANPGAWGSAADVFVDPSIFGAADFTAPVSATLGDGAAGSSWLDAMGSMSPAELELAALGGSAPGMASANIGGYLSNLAGSALTSLGGKGISTLAGAALGLLGSGDKQATASREPWGPAQPLLKDLITSGQNLRQFYSDNPFSPQQMTGYNNMFSDLNSLRASMPGLIDFANRMSGATYSRDGGMSYGTNKMFATPTGSAYAPVNFAQYKGLL